MKLTWQYRPEQYGNLFEDENQILVEHRKKCDKICNSFTQQSLKCFSKTN